MEKIFEWLDNPENIAWIKQNLIYIILIAVAFVCLLWFIKYMTSKRNRQHFKFHMHHLSYVLGLRKTMSRHWVGRVHVHECFDPLVDFLPHKNIIFNNDTIEQPNLIRKKVLLKLYRIADRLPEGTNLLVLSTFRSKAKKDEAWKAVLKQIIEENPGIGINAAMKLARLKTSDPRDNSGGHGTGAAVDVALCNDKGEMFDYGTKFHEYTDVTLTRSSKLTSEQKYNRKQLIRLMRRYGFVNFPTEWWHFSYGDRVWAAYKGRRNGGIYSSAETEVDGTYKFTIPVNRTIHETHK